MATSLKADLIALQVCVQVFYVFIIFLYELKIAYSIYVLLLQNEKTRLEEQVTVLEKDLENATEAGLELEHMLREVLSSNNEINPLAQSVEDLKARLDAQQTANESLTNALNLKAQEVRVICLLYIFMSLCDISLRLFIIRFDF